MDDKSKKKLLHQLSQIEHRKGLETELDEVFWNPPMALHEYLEKLMSQNARIREGLVERGEGCGARGRRILEGGQTLSRDQLLSLCIDMRLELPEVQRALSLASCEMLYVKRRRDTILIFCILNRLSAYCTNQLLFDLHEAILK